MKAAVWPCPWTLIGYTCDLLSFSDGVELVEKERPVSNKERACLVASSLKMALFSNTAEIDVETRLYIQQTQLDFQSGKVERHCDSYPSIRTWFSVNFPMKFVYFLFVYICQEDPIIPVILGLGHN